MMILLVDFEVIGQIVDSLGQNRDLNFGGAGVSLVQSILLNNLLFFFF